MKTRVAAAAAVLALGAGIAAVGHRDTGLRAETDSERATLDGGIEFFRARLVQRPRDVVAAIELANRYLTRFGSDRDIADVWSAESALARALDAHAGFAPALARLASVHITRHEFPEALAAAEAAYRAAPRQSNNGPLFDAYFELARYDSASAALNRMDPHSFGYLIRKARFVERLGDTRGAAYALARACRPTEMSHGRLRAWCAVRQADIARAMGRANRAKALYREALRHWSGYTAAVAGLAHVAFQEGRLEEAERLYHATAGQPGGAEAHLMLARIASLRGEHDLAELEGARFEQMVKHERYGRAYWPYLARYYAEQGSNQTAIELARADVAQRQGPEAYHTLAVVLFHSGRATEARAAIDSAMTWGQPDAEMLYHAGLIRIAEGDRGSGSNLLQRALSDPAGLDADYAGHARSRLGISSN